MLRDVTDVRLAMTVLGTALRAPFAVAPTTMHLAAHPDGEVAMARGIAEAGSLMVVSSNAGSTFEDIAATGLPVVVKGVLRPEDARRCVDAGASALWVSNHGGRQLDYTAATADCLEAVVAAFALGARAVFLGRLPV